MPRQNGSKKLAKKRVYFKLEAPEAKEVVVAGTFNDWDTRPLKPSKKGVWSTFMSLESGVYEYRYLVDGEWKNAPNAESVPNAFGTENCVEVV